MEKVIDTIRKLLAMANHPGSNEHEASLAMEKAQALLRNHNLSTFDIKDKPDPSAVRHSTFGIPDDRKGSAWRILLADGIAQANQCRVLQSGHSIIVIGRPENVEVVWDLYKFVVEQVEKFNTQSWKVYEGTEKKGMFKRGFYLGCTRRIRERLAAELRAAQQAESMTRALVVVRDAELVQYVDNVWGKLRKGQASGGRGYGGYEAGKAAGNNVALSNRKRLS